MKTSDEYYRLLLDLYQHNSKKLTMPVRESDMVIVRDLYKSIHNSNERCAFEDAITAFLKSDDIRMIEFGVKICLGFRSLPHLDLS